MFLKRVISSILMFLLAMSAFASSEKDNPFRKVARDVTPVVVQIDTVTKTKVEMGRNPFEFFFNTPENEENEDEPNYREYESKGLGSGIVVEADGKTKYVITNHHVIQNATSLKVTFPNGEEYDAEIVGSDPRKDLGLLKFVTSDSIPVAKLGDSDDIYIGDWAIAIGSPLGYESTVTVGIISAIGRDAGNGMEADFTDYIQTDAAINRGNSGGALVNIDGEVIGINTWIASQTGGSIGLGFSVPINNAKTVIRDLIDKGQVEYGWLGVSMGDIPSEILESLKNKNQEGAFIHSLFKNSPADKGGLKPGDIITKVGTKTITSSNDLLKAVGNLPAGKLTRFTVIRDGKTSTLNIYPELRTKESQDAMLWPGINSITLTSEIIEAINQRLENKIKGSVKGVVVVNVAADSIAQNAGLRQGDIITHIEGKKISDQKDMYTEFADADTEVTLTLLRSGKKLKLILINE